MKRDPELIRRILLAVEAREFGVVRDADLGIDDVKPEILGEHVLLLRQAEYIDATIAPGSVARSFVINRITWDGHEYLSSVKSDTVWASVKQTAKEKGVDLSFELLKAFAVAKTKALLGMPPV